jgi:hypothetical protein
MSEPVNVLCIYRVKQGQEDQFKRILEKHWPALDRAGLVSSTPVQVFRETGKDDAVIFIEMFQWKNEESPRAAHQAPEVMAVWGPMDTLTDKMEFLDLESVTF